MPTTWAEFVAWIQQPWVQRVAVAVAATGSLLLARYLIRRSIGRRVTDNSTQYRARKLVDFGAWVAFALLMGIVFNAQLSGLTVALGVAGAGIAFALQEVIVSVAGWLAIMLAGFFKVGDRVQLGGIKGDVIDIGVLRTTVFEVGDWVDGDLYNGRVVRIANSFVFKEPVFNYSGDFPFLWDEVKVPLRHESDRDRALALLTTAAEEVTGEYARTVASTWSAMTKNYLLEHAQVEPMVTMAMDQNWLTYTVRYVVEFKRRRRTKHELTRRILDAIDATDGAVRVATSAQEVTLVGSSPSKHGIPPTIE